MAKRKIKKPKSGKSWRDWFSWGKRKESRAAREEKREQLYRRVKIAALSIFLPLLPAGLVVGFFYMEKHVHALRAAAPVYGALEFVNAPDWAFSEAMKKKLSSSAGGGQFELKEGVAEAVGARLAELPWLYNVHVRTTTHNVLVEAQYREPQAIIKTAKGQTCYVGLPAASDPLCGDNPDEVNTVFVLDYVEIKKPPLIMIKGFADNLAPAAGKTWFASDVAAALKLIAALRAMDEKVSKEKPLSEEISEIDISNFNGKLSRTSPHIVLKLKDGKTQVNWGAAMGQSARHLEASDIEKLTTLYTFYREHKNTLQNIVSFIELRPPKMGIPRPQ
ncbi:MAG: hypothetical protein ABFD91_03380 [Anaerohalosphaeraceae bacterium]